MSSIMPNMLLNYFKCQVEIIHVFRPIYVHTYPMRLLPLKKKR